MKGRKEMLNFSKYHGCGNNFVMVKEHELLEYLALGNDADLEGNEYPAFAQKACDINTGIGADGLIIVREEPQLEMVFYNMDGSRAPMCGNGIRCFAYFCQEEGIREEGHDLLKVMQYRASGFRRHASLGSRRPRAAGLGFETTPGQQWPFYLHSSGMGG